MEAGVMGGVARAGTTEASDPGNLTLTEWLAESRRLFAVGCVSMFSLGVALGFAGT
jgi:hypothetical protein